MTQPPESPETPRATHRPRAGHEKLLTGGILLGILAIGASILSTPAPQDGRQLPLPVVNVAPVRPTPRAAEGAISGRDSALASPVVAQATPPSAVATTPAATATDPVPKSMSPSGPVTKPSKPTAKAEQKTPAVANKRGVPMTTKNAAKTRGTAVTLPKEEAPPTPATRPVREVSLCDERFTSQEWPGAFEACSSEAARGARTAQRHLAVLYLDGHGIKRNEREAVRLFTEAANAGDTESMVQLANALERGRGTSKDEAGAVRWYQKAAESGIAAAQYALGQAYERGRLGLKKDKPQAIEWYLKAAEHGFGDAARKARDLSK